MAGIPHHQRRDFAAPEAKLSADKSDAGGLEVVYSAGQGSLRKWHAVREQLHQGLQDQHQAAKDPEEVQEDQAQDLD